VKTNSVSGLILVLGSPNSDNGKLYSIASERCQRAMDEYQRHPDYKVLLTGGYGEHFNTTNKPHAFYLKQYLLKAGLPNDRFVECVESKNTLEDASLSKPIVMKYQAMHIIVITSDYHYERAKCVFEKEFTAIQVMIEFSITQTDEAACEIDLVAIKEHEIRALKKLRHEQDT
jgi:uncharacterized SAM-binding protein YcdF (DUF218 family)